jgi:hypothetical protein
MQRKSVPGDYGGRDMQRWEGTRYTRKPRSRKVMNDEHGDALSCFQRRTFGIVLLLWAKGAHGHVRVQLAAPEVQREAAELQYRELSISATGILWRMFTLGTNSGLREVELAKGVYNEKQRMGATAGAHISKISR